MKKSKTQRIIRISGLDIELNLSKAAAIKSGDKQMIHLDKLPDGSWRLIYSKDLIQDFSKVKSLDIIRIDE